MLATIRAQIESRARPVLAPVQPNIWVLAFPLMKLVVARTILARSLDRGDLHPGQTVVETTSGTMGLGLAYAAREHDLPLVLVGDPAIDEALRQRLIVLGAKVEVVSVGAAANYQKRRLELVAEILAESEGFFTNQYDNPDCLAAYEAAAHQVTSHLGPIDWLVASTGSGASGSGLARAISRNQGAPVGFAAVDTPGSVLFGQPDAPRRFRGLGNSLVPKNLLHELVDEVHWINVGPAAGAANALHTENLLDVGPTSGAAYLAALDLSRRRPSAKIVFVAPDSGERYRGTFLSTAWLHGQGLLEAVPADGPTLVDSPEQGVGPWSRMHWKRRSLAQLAA